MALPKALLCRLGQPAPGESWEETQLRSAGFATATLDWRSLDDQPHGWTRLAELLEETPGLRALVLSGPPESLTSEIIAQTALLSLSFTPDGPFSVSFILEDSNPHEADHLRAALPPLLSWAKVYLKEDPFASRLMAARFKEAARPELPFRLRAHLSPLIGLWLEVGPDEGDENWPGFFLATVGATIDALGTGPRGTLPKKCTLEFPMLNIEGTLSGHPWNGCAAKNTLDPSTSAFIKLSRPLDKLLMSAYPDDSAEESSATVLAFN